MHVLIVEDNALVASGIRSGLQLHGMTCDVAHGAQQARTCLLGTDYDGCVLDLGLPDGDGLALLQTWRRSGNAMPVLILTARDTLQDKVAGFRTGTDDYLTKPFDLQELVLRLHALYRRAGGRASDWLAWGDGLRLNPASFEAFRDGQPVELSRREWSLLSALLQANGRILSAAQLHDSLYGFNQDVGSNAVNVHIHNLRRKLGPGIIDTVRGLGFRFGLAYCKSEP